MSLIQKLITHIRNRGLSYDSLIKIYISRNAILHNYKIYGDKFGLSIAPVLKSNAYGHGLFEVAKILEDAGAPFYAVDSFFEARTLRDNGIKNKILIIGYSPLDHIESNLKNTSYAVTSHEQLSKLSNKLTSRKNIHLKIDTGMHRQGILLHEIPSAIKLIKNNPNILLEGIFSHFADADGMEKNYSLRQIEVWNLAVETIQKEFPPVKYLHLSASAGTFYSNKINANVVRLGIGLYGINTSPHQKLDLMLALSMVSRISLIKHLERGDKVSYNLTYEAKKTTKIAVIPAGYFEGVDRRLSNAGSFKIGGTICPIIGRVCMNISMADITDLRNVRADDEVIIFSDDSNDKNTISNVAKICGTNPHEILVHIPAHLRRKIVN